MRDVRRTLHLALLLINSTGRVINGIAFKDTKAYAMLTFIFCAIDVKKIIGRYNKKKN